MSVTKLSKSKFLKVFLVLFVFLFSFQINVNKPKAFAPLVGWGAAILTGMAAETLVTMGVKAGSKAVLKKQAKNYSENMQLQGKFDWDGLNPYRNKDGSITLSPKANDRAKMAGLIAGTLTGMAFGPNGEPLENPEAVCYNEQAAFIGTTNTLVTAVHGPDLDRLTFYAGGEEIAWNGQGYGYWSQYTDYQVRITNINMYNQVTWKLYGLRDGAFEYMDNGSMRDMQMPRNTLDHFKERNAELCSNGEIAFPSTVQRVYPAPMDMSSTFKMPNEKELTRPMVIYNVLPAGEEGPISFDDLEKFFAADPQKFEVIVDKSVDKYLEGAVLNKNPFTIEEINNYYTDINYPVKLIDFKPPTGDVSVPDDNLPAEPVDDLDHSIWEILRNTYNYLDDGIDSSLAAMKGITDSAKGITNYLASAMGWLPPEWRAVFTSAFVLGVFAHFLRR